MEKPKVEFGQRGLIPASKKITTSPAQAGAGTEKADSPEYQQADGLSLFPQGVRMADEWIKMRRNLWNHPNVLVLATRLKTTRATVIGALHGLWSLADEHSEDGKLGLLGVAEVDAFVELPGFSDAVSAVGWLEKSDDGLAVPNYETHNGATGKRRATEARRKTSARDADELRTTCGQNAPQKKKKKKSEKKKENLEEELHQEKSGAVFGKLLLSSGKEFPICEEKIAEWASAYPTVDVPGEVRKAIQWCIDNPGKRKTTAGALRFLSSWLSRATKPRTGYGDPQAVTAAPSPYMSAEETRARNADAIAHWRKPAKT